MCNQGCYCCMQYICTVCLTQHYDMNLTDETSIKTVYMVTREYLRTLQQHTWVQWALLQHSYAISNIQLPIIQYIFHFISRFIKSIDKWIVSVLVFVHHTTYYKYDYYGCTLQHYAIHLHLVVLLPNKHWSISTHLTISIHSFSSNPIIRKIPIKIIIE